MSYVYDNGSLGRKIFRPRVGFTSIKGLGDDSAMAQYQSAHAAWAAATAAYPNAYKGWQAGEANKAAAYQSQLAAYQSAKTAYDNFQAQMAGVRAQLQRLGVVFQGDWLGCAYKAQRDAWTAQCNATSSNTTVKGLGASQATGPACALAKIPLCPDTIPQPPTLPSPPVASPPPPSPGPEPLPPTNTPDSLIPTPPSSAPGIPDPGASTKSGGMLSSGLILLVLAGGGYAIYRTLKKKPAKAA